MGKILFFSVLIFVAGIVINKNPVNPVENKDLSHFNNKTDSDSDVSDLIKHSKIEDSIIHNFCYKDSKAGIGIDFIGCRSYDGNFSSIKDVDIVSFNSYDTEIINPLLNNFMSDLTHTNIITAGEYFDGYIYIQTGYEIPAIGITPREIIKISTYDWSISKITQNYILPDDMSYDYISGNMHVIVKSYDNITSVNYSELYTIDPATGESTYVTKTDAFLLCIAHDLNGLLYGINLEGYLCLIDKNNGNATKIGHTGFTPSLHYQSLAFDPASNKLFWASVCKPEINQTVSFLIEVDPETGVGINLGQIGTKAQIAGLNIIRAPELRVNTFIPDQYSYNVPVNASISIQFNADLTPDNLSDITFSPSVKEIKITTEGPILTIAHEPLNFATTYTITIPKTAIKGLSNDITWTFTTEDLIKNCKPPTHLDLLTDEGNSVSFSWQENGEAESWDIKYGSEGFDPDLDGIFISNITENPYKFEEITRNGKYDFYVRAICNTDNTSEWSLPYTFEIPSKSAVINELTPNNEENNINIDSEIRVRFNENISGINLNKKIVIDPEIELTDISIIDNLLIISHNGFDYNTKYKVEIPEGIIKEYNENIIWSFTTQANTNVYDENANITTINIYPNPSTGLINIRAPHNSLIKIFNISGKIINTLDQIGDSEIQFYHTPGIYFIYIEYNDKTYLKKAIIK